MDEHKCTICKKVFKTVAGLKAHTTSKKVPCTPPPEQPSVPQKPSQQPPQQPPKPLQQPNTMQLPPKPLQQPNTMQLPPKPSLLPTQRQPQPQQGMQLQSRAVSDPNQSQVPKGKIEKQVGNSLGRDKVEKSNELPKSFQNLMENMFSEIANRPNQQPNQLQPTNKPQPTNKTQPTNQQLNKQDNKQDNKGFNMAGFNEGMKALQNQSQQQVMQGGVVNNNTKTFVNGKEVQQFSADYNPMTDYSIPYEERYQRAVAKIVNDVTTEDNGRYANLGEPANLGRLVDRLNRETGSMCMINANNNGRPVMPIMPARNPDDYIYDMFLRNIFSEIREDNRRKERERLEEMERRKRNQKMRTEYRESEMKKAYSAPTIGLERKILGNMLYNLVCNQLSEFRMPEADDSDAKTQQEYLNKKILYMKRKVFFVNNLQDVVNKIVLGEIEYELKKTDPKSVKYEEIKNKYESEKSIFENIMDNDDKLDDVLRDKMYKRIFENLLKMLGDSVSNKSPAEHNELLMSVSRIRSDLEFYIYDYRSSLDEIMRMLMCYDNDKYKQIQTIIFNNLHLGDENLSTMEILHPLNEQFESLKKERNELDHSFPECNDIAK